MVDRKFPPFSLSRLLKTVFAPHSGERVAILIDLERPQDMQGFAFLKDPSLTIQQLAHQHFYQGLAQGVKAELGLAGGEMFAYAVTGGSNLDLPATLWNAEGQELSFEKDLYAHYDLILCISTYSATAPLTAAAKRHGFRGATLHGLNPIILSTGLAVDYDEVSREAEALRSGLTRSDCVDIDFRVDGQEFSLRLELGAQEAQKSHGLCRGGPDVANLPAGEVYFVPTGGEGHFPLKLEGGTVAKLQVRQGKAVEASLLRGDELAVEELRQKLASEPAWGTLGELGFGTQDLPVSGQDIQDEKIFGTFHIALGRNDHLGGGVTPDQFKVAQHATHDDILFSPEKTPEIEVPRVTMHRRGEAHLLFENYRSAEYLLGLRHGQPL